MKQGRTVGGLSGGDDRRRRGDSLETTNVRIAARGNYFYLRQIDYTQQTFAVVSIIVIRRFFNLALKHYKAIKIKSLKTMTTKHLYITL